MKRILIIPLLFPLVVHAAYKCEVGDKVVYQQFPCAEESAQTIVKTKKTKSPIERGIAEPYKYGLMVTPVSIEVQSIDSLGSVWIGYKATVYNQTDMPQKVFINFQGINRQGYEVKSIMLSGTVAANKKTELTNNTYLSGDEYDKIWKWQLEK